MYPWDDAAAPHIHKVGGYTGGVGMVSVGKLEYHLLYWRSN